MCACAIGPTAVPTMMSVGLPLMFEKTGQTFSAQSKPRLERMWQMRVLCKSSTHQGVTCTRGYSLYFEHPALTNGSVLNSSLRPHPSPPH